MFGFVFRNQLRKLVGTVIEGFSQFKKQSKVKSKLLLHTNFSEGWDIPAFAEEFGVKNEDILTTYFCRSCKQVHISPFVGNGIKCPICHHEGSAANATIVEGITTDQLNIVYNLMDAYVHPATSGGLEMPIVEAMLCGLPCATVDYSFGEDFIKSGLVYPLSYSTYREIGANFIKASPHGSSVAAFMKKVERNRAEYEEIGRKSRAWAQKEFDPKKTAKVLEDFIDNSSHNFDFNFEKQRGNEEYPLQDIQDDTEWLIDMYKNILNMEENNESQGVKDWLKTLASGKTRKEIYDFFIATAKQENATRSKPKKDLKDFF